MNKPIFDPNQPFQPAADPAQAPVEASAETKPAFDPGQPSDKPPFDPSQPTEDAGSFGNQLLAGEEGVERGLTQGVSDVFRTKVEPYFLPKSVQSNPEEMKARQQENPVTSGAGELLGGAALLAGTQGLGAPLLASKAGLSGLSAVAAAGAAQGAALAGTSSLTNDLAFGDPTLTASKIAAHAGLSALIGAGFGGISNALIDAASSKLGGSAGKLISDFSNRLSERANIPDPVEAVTKELQPYFEMSQDSFNAFGPNGLKMEAIQKSLPNNLTDGMVGQAQDLLAKGRSSIQSMMADPDYYSKFYTRSLNRSLNVLQDALSEPGEPFELFQAMNEFKQNLDDIIPHGGLQWASLPAADKPAVQLISGMTNDLRAGLQDPSVWGKAGEVQQQINSAFKNNFEALKDFQSKFAGKSASGERFLDPQKVQTYLNQAGKAGQIVKKEMLGKFIQSNENFQNVISEVNQSLGMPDAVKLPSLDFTKSTLNPYSTGAKMADKLFKNGSSVVGHALGIGTGAAIGSAVGSPVIGGYAGEKILSPAFRALIPDEAFLPFLKHLDGVNNVIKGVDGSIADKARLIFTGASSQARKLENE